MEEGGRGEIQGKSIKMTKFQGNPPKNGCQNLKMSVSAKRQGDRPYLNPGFAPLESAESTHV
jgi:hypothetical protein